MSSIVQVPACLITDSHLISSARPKERNAADETKMTSRPARC